MRGVGSRGSSNPSSRGESEEPDISLSSSEQSDDDFGTSESKVQYHNEYVSEVVSHIKGYLISILLTTSKERYIRRHSGPLCWGNTSN